MQDIPSGSYTSLKGLSDADWRAELSNLAFELGYFQQLGDRHFATFVDEGPVLLVTFETSQGIQTLSPTAHPLGFDLVQRMGCSHLCLVSDGDTWFRDPAVYSYIDRLVDDGFFEDFDRVLFYGAGPCGYAAAAYSVAAPGASVIALQPQATLDPRVTEWDPRFTELRKTSFTDRYGFAPDMIEAAHEGFVIYDPAVALDAMHAALFTRPNVTKLRMPHMGAQLQTSLIDMGLLARLLTLGMKGQLNPTSFARMMRARRSYRPYLRNLMATLDLQDRPELVRMLCQNVTARMSAPRFARRLKMLDDPTLATAPTEAAE